MARTSRFILRQEIDSRPLRSLTGCDRISIVKVPAEVPVMVLPNAILFPQALLPLYIFEDRYRQMLSDCLAGDRMFSVALLQEDSVKKRGSKPCAVAGLGIIRVAIGKDDGTSNIILQGLARVKICGFVKQKPYPVVQIEPLQTLHAETVDADPLAAKVSELLRARATLDMALPEHVAKYLTTMKDTDNLADLVSFTLLSDSYEKQEILETLDLRRRLQRLIDLLEKEKNQLLYWKKLQGDVKDKEIGLN